MYIVKSSPFVLLYIVSSFKKENAVNLLDFTLYACVLCDTIKASQTVLGYRSFKNVFPSLFPELDYMKWVMRPPPPILALLQIVSPQRPIVASG